MTVDQRAALDQASVAFDDAAQKCTLLRRRLDATDPAVLAAVKAYAEAAEAYCAASETAYS